MNKAISLAALLVLGASSFAEQLLEDASFEVLPVTKRKSIAEGGDISKASGEWIQFLDKSSAEGGRIIMGLTNEIARSGRQSMFVKFDNVTQRGAIATLSSELIPILPKKPYHVAIFGRVDREDPVALDQRLPYLKLRVEWFTAPPKEGEEEDTNPTGQPEPAGDVEYRVQPLPGSKKRTPLFTSAKWSEFFADLTSPANAATMKITWTWETALQDGVTNGVMYFDDAGVLGESGPKEDFFAGEPEPTDEDEKPADAAKPAEAPKTATPAVPKSLDVTPVSTPPPRDPKKEEKPKK